MPSTLRPTLVFIIGIAIDNAIARGWLLPQQRQIWVDGALTVIGASGTIILTIISLWHEYTLLHKKNEQVGYVTKNPNKSFIQLVITAFKSFFIQPKLPVAPEAINVEQTPPNE